jgi:hypothetical protein
MPVNNSQYALAAPELIAAVGGIIGTLLYNPVILILDNQSTTAAVLFIDGVQFKTFTGGEAIVLDLRAAHALASNYSFRIGAVFTTTGAANGNFSISYTYAKDS